jgi:hypothetical protein
MADTKISALTTDSTPDRIADYLPTYDASAVGNKKITVENAGGYALMMFLGNSASPADATTYYFTPVLGNLPTVAASVKMRIPRAGVIRKVYIDGNCTVGTSETSTMSIRLNDTTDTTITSAAAFNATPFAFSNTAMTVTVSAGDYITVKWVTPSPGWVTNPTALGMWAMIWVA